MESPPELPGLTFPDFDNAKKIFPLTEVQAKNLFIVLATLRGYLEVQLARCAETPATQPTK